MTSHLKGRPRHRLRAAAVVSCAINQQQEVELGAQTAAEIDTMLPLIRDPAINAYINGLGNQLAKATDTRNLTWHFTVVDSKEVNAFAIPGGWIYINRGLIERAANMSEVAGVLGHEIGHVTLRHTVEQMQQQQEVGIGAVALVHTYQGMWKPDRSGRGWRRGGAPCSPSSADRMRRRRTRRE
jgi:predicted Zn-dependent protease